MIEQAKTAAMADVKEKLELLQVIETELENLQKTHRKVVEERDTLNEKYRQQLEAKDDVTKKLLEREEEVRRRDGTAAGGGRGAGGSRPVSIADRLTLLCPAEEGYCGKHLL